MPAGGQARAWEEEDGPSGSDSGPSDSGADSQTPPNQGQGQADRDQARPARARETRTRCSVRQRNNRRVRNKKDTARITKKIQVICSIEGWERLLEAFRLAPLFQDERSDRSSWVPTMACLQIRSPDQKNPPSAEISGIHIGCRWVRNGKAGYWDGDHLDLSTIGINVYALERFVRPTLHQDQYEQAIDRHMRARLAAEPCPTGFVLSVKLKVELFETKLPSTKHAAPAIHSYAGPYKNRETDITIPPYVPDECFLDLNAQAQCWIAKTIVERGIVLTTHYHVGPDHCFMPNETIFFRNNTRRFQKPIWVISPDEAKAFSDLGEDFLVKRTLKRGDRFVLVAAFDRKQVYGHLPQVRPQWWVFEEEEPVSWIAEPQDGWVITQKTARYFALEGAESTVKVTHCDCTCLTLQVPHHAVVGMPLEHERMSGVIPHQADDPRNLPPTEYYMDLRNRLGFNAMGLLHDPEFEQQCLVECPLNRLSVTSPTSRLLFLDHWRDEQEQKAFWKVIERIQDLTCIRNV